jgi:hypothetical protein
MRTKYELKRWLLKCKRCGRTEVTSCLAMLAWSEAECCGEGCMEVSSLDMPKETLRCQQAR